jgi:hypothetical protein
MTHLDYVALVDTFRQVAQLADVKLPEDAMTVETLLAPHKPPPSLPMGMMAVYVFSWKARCLKVGKAGPNSHARYAHQHCSPGSSRSNLAKSLLATRDELGLSDLTDSNVGAWMRANVDRTNFLLHEDCGIPTLTLLEAFLQCRLKPRFEGFSSQRQ